MILKTKPGGLVEEAYDCPCLARQPGRAPKLGRETRQGQDWVITFSPPFELCPVPLQKEIV